MSHLRTRLFALLAAAALALALTLAGTVTAPPARALTFTQQCDGAAPMDCLNFWGGGNAVRTYDGTAANNQIKIQWLASGGFELRDEVHGGCVGDLNGSQTSAQLGGGLNCPSPGPGDWGTVFRVYAQCSGGYSVYQANHWPGKFVGFAVGSNHPVYANTAGGICLKQLS